MTNQQVIAASILAADFVRLGEEIKKAEAGGTDWIHVDVMDGHFVPNLTMGPMIVEACKRATDLPLDVHLMVEEPERLLSDFADAGASGLTVHVEVSHHLNQTLNTIKGLGLRAGVALNPSTPLSTISEVVDIADLVLVMTVNPGYGGQTLIESTLNKVSQLRELCESTPSCKILIEVDGGINSETAYRASQAGANVFVAGNAVFNHPSGAKAGVQAIREALNP
ncbi:MAG: ribulose-phosphate 3-epimerase [Anaerolineales bacterium]|nr:ribulose-phosphate 3-epimerase [Anaerolineales bacterium]